MATSSAAPARHHITLSSPVDRVEVRPGLAETVPIEITNSGAKATFVDVSVDAERPLESSKTGISTYVPAHYTVNVAVRVTAVADADEGTVPLVFTTGSKERLAIFCVVANPPDARLLPRDAMTATATSAQLIPDHKPQNAIDGNPSTLWHTKWNPVKDPLPQSLTLELGGVYDVAELIYEPRTIGGRNGIITVYSLHGSTDGQSFTELTDGEWAADTARKHVVLGATGLSYLRLVAHEGYGGYASAAEIVLYGRAAR
ncbi:MAG TPA: discoidin domain-containing protein [Actinopolymorphaceae bacterium]